MSGRMETNRQHEISSEVAARWERQRDGGGSAVRAATSTIRAVREHSAAISHAPSPPSRVPAPCLLLCVLTFHARACAC